MRIEEIQHNSLGCKHNSLGCTVVFTKDRRTFTNVSNRVCFFVSESRYVSGFLENEGNINMIFDRLQRGQPRYYI